jgi:hypothetical protein
VRCTGAKRLTLQGGARQRAGNRPFPATRVARLHQDLVQVDRTETCAHARRFVIAQENGAIRAQAPRRLLPDRQRDRRRKLA